MPESNRSPIIIDCDTGRDDAMSLWYAIAEDLKPAAVIGTYGNTPRRNVLQNCLDVLSLAESEDVPVYSGAVKPSHPHPLIERLLLPKQAISGNGLCNVRLPKSSANALEVEISELASKLERLAAHEGPLEYAVLGPATTAWQLSRFWGDKAANIVKHFTMLGGRFDASWKRVPIPDFNIGCDPFAFKGLLKSGVPVRLVSLNTTWNIQLSLESVQSLVPTTLIGEVAKTLMEQHCLYFSPEPIFRFHDPTLIYALMHDQYFSQRQVDVNVNTDDKNFGRLSVSNMVTTMIHTAGVFTTNALIQADIRTTILNCCGLALKNS